MTLYRVQLGRKIIAEDTKVRREDRRADKVTTTNIIDQDHGIQGRRSEGHRQGQGDHHQGHDVLLQGHDVRHLEGVRVQNHRDAKPSNTVETQNVRAHLQLGQVDHRKVIQEILGLARRRVTLTIAVDRE